MKKGIKWLFRIIGILLVCLIVAGVLFPFVYKDRVQNALKSALNERIDAEVDFADMDLSLFRSFPRVSLQLDSLSIKGKGEFENLYLLRSESVDLALAFFSLINEDEPYTIHEVNLNKPILDIVVLENGKANYELSAPSGEQSSSGQYSVALEKYTINEGFLMYRDKSQDLMIELDNVDHSGSGDFSQDLFALATQTDAEALTVKQNGLKYLNNVGLQGTVDLGINQKENIYTFSNTDLRINALPLEIAGSIQNGAEVIGLDLDIKSVNASFKELFSLIPGVYKKGYENAEFAGLGDLAASIKGDYNAAVPRYPKINASIKLSDGRIKYPGSPKILDNVQLIGNILANRGDWSDLSAEFNKIGWTMDGQPGQATFSYNAQGSNPKVAGSLDATILLEDWKEVMALADGQNLSGKLVSDISFQGGLADIENKNYNALGLDGTFNLSALKYSSADAPDLSIQKLSASGSPAEVKLEIDQVGYGETQLQEVDVDIADPLQYFSEKSAVSADVRFKAQRLDYADFSGEPSTESDPVQSDYPQLDLSVSGEVDEFKYDEYVLKNIDLNADVRGEELDLKSIDGKLDGNPLKVKGKFAPILAFSNGNAPLKGYLNVSGKKLDLNPYLEETTQEKITEDAASVPLPADMDVVVELDIDEVLYTNLNLENVKGQAHLIDQKLDFNGVTSQLLGGDLKLNGFYSTPPGEEQVFDVALQIAKLPFQKAVTDIGGFKNLAPIMKYMDGEFNTTLNLSGLLQDDMSLNYNALNGNGFLETIKGTIKSVPALNTLADKFNIDIESLVDLANSKSVFEINNGAVVLKPETLNIGKDVKMTVSGSHGLDQAMNYSLNFAIPRELLKKSSILGTAEKGLGFLENQARKYGVNIDQGNTILVDAIVTGSLTSPSVDIRPRLATNTSVGNLLEQEKIRIQDSLNQIITDTRKRVEDSIRTVISQKEKEIKDRVNDQIDSTKKVIKDKINDKIDSTKSDVTDRIKDEVVDGLGGLLGGNKKDSTETKKDPVKDATDKLKDEIKQWNPFGGKG